MHIFNEWFDNLRMLTAIGILSQASEKTGIKIWFDDPPDFSMTKIIGGDIKGLLKALHSLNKKDMLGRISEFLNFCDVCEEQQMEFPCKRAICKKDRALQDIIEALQSTPVKERDALCKEIEDVSGKKFSRKSSAKQIGEAFRALLDKGYMELLGRGVTQIRDINPCEACKTERLEFECPWLRYPELAKGICWKL